MNELRDIMTLEMTMYPLLCNRDYAFKRDGKNFTTYWHYLTSLSNEDFLETYNRMRAIIQDMD